MNISILYAGWDANFAPLKILQNICIYYIFTPTILKQISID